MTVTSVRRRAAVLAALMVLAAAPQARAVVLAPGGAGSPTGQAAPTGTVLANEMRTFVGTNALGQVLYDGTLTSTVIRTDVAYTNGSFTQPVGALTFVYRVANDGSQDSLTGVSVTGFIQSITPVVDADYVSSSTGVAPTTVGRDPSTGNTISFAFVSTSAGGKGLIGPGTSTRTLIIRTTATDFQRGSVNTLNGAVATILSFAPAPSAFVVPEPATLGGILAVLPVLGGLWLRQRKKAAAGNAGVA